MSMVTLERRPTAGAYVRSTVTFKAIASGAPGDPSPVAVKYGLSGTAGTTKTYGSDAEVVKVEPGVYRIDVPCSAGTMVVRWIPGTGYNPVEDTFVVDASQLS